MMTGQHNERKKYFKKSKDTDETLGEDEWTSQGASTGERVYFLFKCCLYDCKVRYWLGVDV